MDGNGKAQAGKSESETAPRQVKRITSQQLELIRLRDAATVLLDMLPSSAKELRSATKWIETCRWASDHDAAMAGEDVQAELRQAREMYRTLWECGIDCGNKVGALVWETNRLLPDAGQELRHLRGLKPHDWEREQFDLEPALAELRMIVAQAIHHCGVPASVLHDREIAIVVADEEMGDSHSPATGLKPPETPLVDDWGSILGEFQRALAQHGDENIWLVVTEYPETENSVTVDFDELSDKLGLGGLYVEHDGGRFHFAETRRKAAFTFFWEGRDAKQPAVAAFKCLASRAGAIVAVDGIIQANPAIARPQELWLATIHAQLRDSPVAIHSEPHTIYRPFLASIEALKLLGNPPEYHADSPPAPTVKPKRSTARGDAAEKIKAALREHHKYDGNSCLHCEPIGVNELHRKAKVGAGSVTGFFNREFKVDRDGHKKYQQCCRDSGRLIAFLKLLSGDYAAGALVANADQFAEVE